MYYVYIIKSEEDRYYIGETDNIEKRLIQHNTKDYKCWTNKFNNWILVYNECFETKKEALIRERVIKNYKGGFKFKNLVNPYIAE